MRISIVVPCFNKERTVPLFLDEVKEFKGVHEFEYSSIDDESRDGMLIAIKKLASVYPYVRLVSLSKNFEREVALYAGLRASTGDLATTVNVGLQDPPELLPKMINRITASDTDYVSTWRLTCEGEPAMHSFFAKKFYQLINKISDIEMTDDTCDLRSMARQMMDVVLELTECNRFSKGSFSRVGFKTGYISYENHERVTDETS